MPYRVVFMGTPEFAVPSLEALLTAEDFAVVGVVTQPDRPAGRGSQMRPSPVKVTALAAAIPVYQPEKLRGEEAVAHLSAWQPDIYVVTAYGQILRQNILAIPPHGSVNVHGSLLPRWRGASPIQACIRAGDDVSGLTIMLMDAGMDTGPMLYKAEVPLAPAETAQSLHDKLAAISGATLLAGLRGYLAGELTPMPQDDAHATYATMLNKTDGHIDWTQPAVEIDRLVRAFTPWPSGFTHSNGMLLKILGGQVAQVSLKLAAGEVALHTDHYPMLVGTGAGIYAPTMLQLEGRKALPVTEFVNGMAHWHGTILG